MYIISPLHQVDKPPVASPTAPPPRWYRKPWRRDWPARRCRVCCFSDAARLRQSCWSVLCAWAREHDAVLHAAMGHRRLGGRPAHPGDATVPGACRRQLQRVSPWPTWAAWSASKNSSSTWSARSCRWWSCLTCFPSYMFECACSLHHCTCWLLHILYLLSVGSMQILVLGVIIGIGDLVLVVYLVTACLPLPLLA